ncbi:MAG: T9SS type A sorting domain-containing protein [Bacteroidota bacterium]|nr:T9SS type A sorting domain-containing protein [Bacteroidota bacterium]
MKQIFTLLTAIVCLSSASAQINETFENASDLSTFTSSCWQFSGVGLSTKGSVYDLNCLSIVPTTSTSTSTNANNAQIVTPYINVVNGTAISFAYKISNKLSTQASRILTVQLLDIDGTYTNVGTINLDKNSPVSILTFSGVSSVTGVKKLVIDISGNGDGNTYLFLDNLTVNGTYNYNSPYGCSSVARNTLPIKLTSFQGLLSSDKAQLEWSVTSNETGDLFEVEKSSDGKSFKTVAIVAASQKQGAESYSYKEAAQSIAYYRLKIVNIDRTITYSKVIFIKSQTEAINTLSLLQNPIQENLPFSFTSTTNTFTDVTVYNVNGIKIYSTKIFAQKGKNLLSISLDAHLSVGSYLLEVKNNTERNVAKFIKG